jgi:hypothetical protein
VPCRTADAAATFDALMRWFSVLDVVLLWISDKGSHFKNEVVRQARKELKAKHHFTTANCPWSNGTIEFACKQVMRAFRAVLSELKMYAGDWPEVVSMVQSDPNNSGSTRLNKRTPMQVFTGHAETTPLALMLKENVPVNAPLDFIKGQKLMEVEKMSKAMTEIHAQVVENTTRDRKACISEAQQQDARAVAELPSGRLRTCRGTPQERCVQVAGQVEGPAPRRECRVRLRVRRRASTHERAQSRARNMVEILEKTRISMSLRSWPRPLSTTKQLYVVSTILDARYNEEEMFHEFVGRVARFPRWRGHLGTLLSYGCGCS